jgi:hypothetical protein
MPTCPKCKAEVNESNKFCTYCGASLKFEAPSQVETRVHVHERDACFGEKERDYLGLVSFGFFLLTVGIVFTMNPNIVDDFRSWIILISTAHMPVRPPEGLIYSATLFFSVVGIFDFAMAGIRLAAHDLKRRVLTDVLSGFALILFAYLIHLYIENYFTWQMVLGTEAIVCGILVTVYSIARYWFKRA